MNNQKFCLLLGAARSGTTAFFYCFKSHLDISASNHKELHFFDQKIKYNLGYGWYRNQFNGDGIAFEATPFYLYHPSIPKLVYKFVCEFDIDIKFVILLRNPIDRAYSHFHHSRKRFFKRRTGSFAEELETFEETIKVEDIRLQNDLKELETDPYYNALYLQAYSYLARSRYVEQLVRWFKFFPKDKFLILRAEDFYTDPQCIFEQTLNFLNLDNKFIPSPKIHNINKGSYEPIKQETKEYLQNYFKSYNQDLYDLLSKDFGWDL